MGTCYFDTAAWQRYSDLAYATTECPNS